MYLYGASGHAKVIIDILRANNEPIEALFDDNEKIHTLFDYPVLRSSEVCGPLIISIGNNGVRRKIAEKLQVEYGRVFSSFGNYFGKGYNKRRYCCNAGAIVQSDCRIGSHCIINTGASVDHECRLGDYVHISPHCTLCGNVQVGEGAWIGAGSVVIPGVKIGKWSIVGAGSVVTKDIPDGVLAVGNRCKVIKNIVL